MKIQDNSVELTLSREEAKDLYYSLVYAMDRHLDNMGADQTCIVMRNQFERVFGKTSKAKLIT